MHGKRVASAPLGYALGSASRRSEQQRGLRKRVQHEKYTVDYSRLARARSARNNGYAVPDGFLHSLALSRVKLDAMRRLEPVYGCGNVRGKLARAVYALYELCGDRILRAVVRFQHDRAVYRANDLALGAQALERALDRIPISAVRAEQLRGIFEQFPAREISIALALARRTQSMHEPRAHAHRGMRIEPELLRYLVRRRKPNAVDVLDEHIRIALDGIDGSRAVNGKELHAEIDGDAVAREEHHRLALALERDDLLGYLHSLFRRNALDRSELLRSLFHNVDGVQPELLDDTRGGLFAAAVYKPRAQKSYHAVFGLGLNDGRAVDTELPAEFGVQNELAVEHDAVALRYARHIARGDNGFAAAIELQNGIAVLVVAEAYLFDCALYLFQINKPPLSPRLRRFFPRAARLCRNVRN